MDRQTFAAALALAALALPSAVAEDPVVTIPQPDPTGTEASLQALQDDAPALAAGAAAIATGLPAVVFARCPVPPAQPPEAPACDAFAVPTDEEAQAHALVGSQGAAVVADAAGLLGVSSDAFAAASLKWDEAGDVVVAVFEVTGPSALSAGAAITDAVQTYVCAVPAVAVEPPAAPTLACGPDSVVTHTAQGASAVSASAQGFLVRVDAGPTCASAKDFLGRLSAVAGGAIDCAAVPTGGLVVALLPPGP
jgi:hypothetical protein